MFLKKDGEEFVRSVLTERKLSRRRRWRVFQNLGLMNFRFARFEVPFSARAYFLHAF